MVATSSAELDPRVARSRARLVAAATELLVDAGPQAVTVDAVAEHSGVAKSTLYRHWSSRTELLVEVIRANVPVLAAPDPSLGFEGSLRALVDGVAATLSRPEWGRILPALLSLQYQMPDVAALVAADHDCKIEVIGSIVQLGVAEGLLPPGIDAHRASQLLVGPLVFASFTGEGDLHELADHVVERFLASYRVSPPQGG